MFQRFFADPQKRFTSVLFLITLAGLAVRLSGLWQQSMTADEVDTIVRIRSSSSVHELLDTWVRHDGHPPFTHLLEYFWTAVFGFSEGAVRLPFALMGAAAVWFGGRTARAWFSEGAGIATAAGLAFLQFPLMYSQLARPYAPGLFFTMAAAWFWTQWFFGEKSTKRDLILFVLCAVGAAYSHYFSLMMAGLLGIAGLFFLRGKAWKQYLLACASVLLLFLPYSGIFLFQITAGGIGGPGGWLGKPTPAFFGAHLWFIFDSSRPVLFGSAAIAIAALYLFFKRPGKFHLLALFFAGTPLLVGYFYSVYRNPVLQNSVLLFSFPFLLMFIFSWLPNLNTKRLGQFLIFGLTAGLFIYIILYKPFQLTDHFGRLKEIAQTAIKTEQQYGKENVAFAFNVDYPEYMGYYWEREKYTPQQILTTNNNGNEELAVFRKQLEKAKGDYFVYGWSTRYSPLEIPEMIREKYPYLIERTYWFNSAVFVFSKNSDGKYISESTDEIFRSCNYFEPQSEYELTVTGETARPQWTKSCSVQLRDSALLKQKDTATTAIVSAAYSWVPATSLDYDSRIDSACMYSSSLKMRAGDILRNPDNTILFSTYVKLIDSDAQLVMVIQYEREGKSYSWNGRESAGQTDPANTNDWQPVYFGMQVPAEIMASDTISVLCYSKNGKALLLDNLCLKTLTGHTGIYGPRPDLE